MNLRTYMDKHPVLGEGVFVDSTALVIGDVEIGGDSSIWPMTVVRGDVNYIRIGEGSNIQDQSVLHVTHDGPYHPGGQALLIGNHVTVGHSVILHGCTVGNNCLIGMGSIIMDGVQVPDYTLIGAGSLVSPNKRLSPGLWMGRPARRIRDLDSEECEQIEYSALHYIRLKNQYM